MKNGIEIKGQLIGVDNFMNFKLIDAQISKEGAAQQSVSPDRSQQIRLKTCFVRGSNVANVDLSETNIKELNLGL